MTGEDRDPSHTCCADGNFFYYFVYSLSYGSTHKLCEETLSFVHNLKYCNSTGVDKDRSLINLFKQINSRNIYTGLRNIFFYSMRQFMNLIHYL
jgi:hypothetical protein